MEKRFTKKRKLNNKKLKEIYDIRKKKFAYLPVQLVDSSYAWLQYVYLDRGIFKSNGEYKTSISDVKLYYKTQKD